MRNLIPAYVLLHLLLFPGDAIAIEPGTPQASTDERQTAEGSFGRRGGVLMSVDDCGSSNEGCKDATFFKGSYALIIGASNYQNGWQRLGGVAEDVKAIDALLKDQGFETRLLPDPTISQLRQGIQKFIDEVGTERNNRLIIYFAGHGETFINENGVKSGYIVAVDAPTPSQDRRGFYAHSMSMENVMLLAKEIQSRHVLFLFDSCFSGTLFITRSLPKPSPVITYKLMEPVRQFITAGGENESVPDESIFRRRLSEALDGKADLNLDSYVTGTELGEYLMTSVISGSRGQQHPQYGKISDPKLNRGDFIFTVKGRTASLYLNSYPESTISVDGQPVDGFPVLELFVGPGKHAVVFKSAGLAPLTKTITVQVGDVVRCLADFDRREVQCQVDH